MNSLTISRQQKKCEYPIYTRLDLLHLKINFIDDKTALPEIETGQIGSESITEQNASCPSLNVIEPQNQISSSATPSFERTLSKSTEDITSR